jgi:hypothetical protein
MVRNASYQLSSISCLTTAAWTFYQSIWKGRQSILSLRCANDQLVQQHQLENRRVGGKCCLSF